MAINNFYFGDIYYYLKIRLENRTVKLPLMILFLTKSPFCVFVKNSNCVPLSVWDMGETVLGRYRVSRRLQAHTPCSLRTTSLKRMILLKRGTTEGLREHFPIVTDELITKLGCTSGSLRLGF